MNTKLIGLCLLLLSISSCKILVLNPKKELSDGYYSDKTANKKSKVYVNISDNDVLLYPTLSTNNKLVDTLDYVLFPAKTASTATPKTSTLYRLSFDIDLMTMPLKFRFPIKDVPPQLNTPLNGAVFFGLRNDHYKIKYKANPLHNSIRRTVHFGYSFGFFTGLGNTYMSAITTNNIVQNSYNGVVWSNGIAGTVGVNKFTFGLALGFDKLLDKQHKIWAYQNKPWLALTIGLNLN